MFLGKAKCNALIEKKLVFSLDGAPPTESAINERLTTIPIKRIQRTVRWIEASLLPVGLPFLLAPIPLLYNQSVSAILLAIMLTTVVFAYIWLFFRGFPALVAYDDALLQLIQEHRLLQPISAPECAAVLEACAQSEKCETYRQRVLAEGRLFTQAELGMMCDWADGEEQRRVCAKLYGQPG